MKPGKLSDCVRKQVRGLIDGLTESQFDRLFGEVHCNFNGIDLTKDIETAERTAPKGAVLFQIKDGKRHLWLFTVKSEDEIIELLERITAP